jgi:EAL domain-containing protein (putative c-di-GMP-specific phosphodiesterase class I)
MSTGPSTSVDTVHGVIDSRAVRTVFQPVVRLENLGRQPEVVAVEALGRGPQGTRYEQPAVLLEDARAVGRLPELDWILRASAYRTAIRGGLPDGITLFVNAEPDSLGVPCPIDQSEAILDAQLRLRIATELPERAVASDPAALLAAAAACRASGYGVVFDDVGGNPASLALLGLVKPDVVKLGVGVVQIPGTQQSATIVNAVRAYAERSGAVILAEGIETPRHLETAMGMGATLGQGYLFGQPGPIDLAKLLRPSRTVPMVIGGPERTTSRTPYEVIAAEKGTATISKRHLLAATRSLEVRAVDANEPPVLLTCFQEARHLTPSTLRRYAVYAKGSAFVVAFGADVPSVVVPGVRGMALTYDDPLRNEWNVIALGPHFAAALVAQDLFDRGPDMERRFSYALTYDRDLVMEAATNLLGWLY